MKNSFKAYSLSISFFLFIFSIHSQVWQKSISPDYELSIRDKWGDLSEYDAKFVVRNQKIAFTKVIHVVDDNWGTLKFPEDFDLSRGKFDSNSIYDFDWFVEVKKEEVIHNKIHYDSSPNTIFQLKNYDVYPLINENKIDVWGDVIDAYSWTDIKGENIVVRSEVISKQDEETTKYIYVYHFIKSKDEYILLRKITDFNKGCPFDNMTNHIIESIELTDANKDSIGEISFMYTVGCRSDVTPYSLKLMMITDGMKFPVRGETLEIVGYKEDEPIKAGGNYTIGKELELYPVFKRFLEKKWEKYINSDG